MWIVQRVFDKVAHQHPHTDWRATRTLQSVCIDRFEIAMVLAEGSIEGVNVVVPFVLWSVSLLRWLGVGS